MSADKPKVRVGPQQLGQEREAMKTAHGGPTLTRGISFIGIKKMHPYHMQIFIRYQCNKVGSLHK